MGLKFQHFKKKLKIWDFFENFSILEVEIGKNGPGILGVKLGICSAINFLKVINNVSNAIFAGIIFRHFFNAN